MAARWPRGRTVNNCTASAAFCENAEIHTVRAHRRAERKALTDFLVLIHERNLGQNCLARLQTALLFGKPYSGKPHQNES